jgi:hypothetical protein
MYNPSRDTVLGASFLTKQHTSPLTTGNIFTFIGSILILQIWGRVTTAIQAQATTIKLSVTSDAQSAYDICATKDANAFAAGSLLSITGTAAGAMVGTTAVGSIAPVQAGKILATCVTSGVILATYGAASTGAILWNMRWIPLTDDASVAAA